MEKTPIINTYITVHCVPWICHWFTTQIFSLYFILVYFNWKFSSSSYLLFPDILTADSFNDKSFNLNLKSLVKTPKSQNQIVNKTIFYPNKLRCTSTECCFQVSKTTFSVPLLKYQISLRLKVQPLKVSNILIWHSNLAF